MAGAHKREIDRRAAAAWRQAAALPIWSGPVEPQELPGGITNLNFVVEDTGRKFVVRVGGDIEAHGIVRANELTAARAAAEAGVAPNVVHAEPGVLVLDYIEGRTLTPEDVRDPNKLERIVALMRRAHREIPKHLSGPGILFWVFHVIRDYERTLLEEPRTDGAALKRLSVISAELEQAVGPIDLVFGHNDLLAANIIDDGKRLWLIDWEYAGYNSPLFDLGGLSSNSEMPMPMRERMLEAYFGEAVDDELRYRFAAMTAASLLRETLWSMVSERRSQLDFDYAAYTAQNRKRFEQAYAAFKLMVRA